MLEIYIKDYQLSDTGKINNISFILKFKFSSTLEFDIDLNNVYIYETNFNFLGNKYKLICDINELTTFNCIKRGLNYDNLNFTVNYEYNFEDIFVEDRKGLFSSYKNLDFLKEEERDKKGFMVYNFFLNTNHLYSKKKEFEKSSYKPGYILNAQSTTMNFYPISDFIEQRFYQAKFIISLCSEQPPEPNKKSYETYQLEVGIENICIKQDSKKLESINPEFEELILTDQNREEKLAISLKFFNENDSRNLWTNTDDYNKLYTFSGFEDYYIVFNKNFLFKCKLIYKDNYFGNNSVNKIILFLFDLSDFIKINWNIFINNKTILMNINGECKEINFNEAHSEIYWSICLDKLFMIIEEKIINDTDLEKDTKNNIKTINNVLFKQEMESTNDKLLLLFKTNLKDGDYIGDYFQKKYLQINKSYCFPKNYFDDFELLNPQCYEYEELIENEIQPIFVIEDDWHSYDDETKLQEDPDRFIDEACSISEAYDDDTTDYGDPYDAWYESVKNIEIKILGIEIFSLEILKLKILLTYKYTDSECELSYLYLYRVKEFDSYNFSDSLVYFGAIKDDFFIAIHGAKNFTEEYFDEIFTQPLKLINDNIGFKLYKGEYYLTKYKQII